MTGLKPHRHVKDNVTGAVNHTAGFPASQVITCIAFHHEKETNQQCVERFTRCMAGGQVKMPWILAT